MLELATFSVFPLSTAWGISAANSVPETSTVSTRDPITAVCQLYHNREKVDGSGDASPWFSACCDEIDSTALYGNFP